MAIQVITAPEPVIPDSDFENPIIVFLAGSIEQDTAERWQEKAIKIIEEFTLVEDRDIIVLNPRRKSWDTTVTQSISDPVFNEQVQWEIDGLEKADLIIFYFDPNTKSPITLMELGMVSQMSQHQDSESVIVVCPEGFWRKGNVEVVCHRSGIPLVQSLEEFANYIYQE